MKIRPTTTADHEGMKQIWRVCFDDDEAFIALFFTYSNYWQAMVAEEDNVLISMLFALPSTNDFWYIYACATLPQYRQRGIMAQLLDAVYQRALNEKQKGIVIVPADNRLREYYKKHGFIDTFSLKKAIFTPANVVSEIEETELSVAEIVCLRGRFFYNSFAWSETHIDLVRQAVQLANGDIGTFKYQNALGYAVCEPTNHLIVKELAIERAILTTETLQTLANFLGTRFETTKVEFHLNANATIDGTREPFAMLKSPIPRTENYFNLALE